MPQYDLENFDPPAPVAFVTLQNPATGALLSSVPLLIDSGADVTLLPRRCLDGLQLTPIPQQKYELQGFDGLTSQWLEVTRLQMKFLGKNFTGKFLLIDQPMGILGRNILNSLALVLDGSGLSWAEFKPNEPLE